MQSVTDEAAAWAERFANPAMGSRGQATHDAGQQGPRLIPALTEILLGRTERGHPFSHQSRRGAVIALGNMGAQATPALDVLRRLLKDADSTIRWEAARALGAIGPDAIGAVEDLIGCISNPTPGDELPLQATLALGHIGGHLAVERLIVALDEPSVANPVLHRFLQRTAADALAHLGPQARPAMPALQQLLADSDPLTRQSAANALSKIVVDEEQR